MSKCRSCGAPMIWSTNVATGKKIPLDADTNAQGKTRYTVNGDYCKKVTDPPLGELTYVSHFETCPNAKEHSRKASK